MLRVLLLETQCSKSVLRYPLIIICLCWREHKNNVKINPSHIIIPWKPRTQSLFHNRTLNRDEVQGQPAIPIMISHRNQVIGYSLIGTNKQIRLHSSYASWHSFCIRPSPPGTGTHSEELQWVKGFFGFWPQERFLFQESSSSLPITLMSSYEKQDIIKLSLAKLS